MNIRIIGKEDAFSKNVKSNSITYIIILAVFFIGIFLGTLYYKNEVNSDETSKYLQKTIDEMQKTENYDIMQKSLIKNIGIAILFWILGASIIGIPISLFYIAYKGFTLGFTISSFIATFGIIKGNIVAFLILFFQNTFMLLAMTIAMASSIKLAMNLIRRKKDIKYELMRHTIMCILSLGFFILSSIVETLLNGQFLGIILEKIK